MALTFPRAFPLTRFAEVSLVLQRRQIAGATESGDDIVIDRGQPSWLGSWTTNELTDAEARIWDAWLASLKGAARYFLGYDTQRAKPAAYTPSGSMPSAVGALASIAGAQDLATLSGFGAGLILGPGDHINFVQSGKYSLHTVLDAAPVTLTGGAGTVQVEPEIPSWITAGAVCNASNATAKFRLLERPGVTFNADQGPRPGKPLTIKAISTSR